MVKRKVGSKLSKLKPTGGQRELKTEDESQESVHVMNVTASVVEPVRIVWQTAWKLDSR